MTRGLTLLFDPPPPARVTCQCAPSCRGRRTTTGGPAHYHAVPTLLELLFPRPPTPSMCWPWGGRLRVLRGVCNATLALLRKCWLPMTLACQLVWSHPTIHALVIGL